MKQHPGARALSVLLSFLMALPVLALLLLPGQAVRAQSLAGRQPTWAVLDFANPSGYGSTDVGRLAADSFVVELAKLNRYAVLPRQDLLNGIQSEGLTPPLNLTSIQRLGQGLGVDAMVAGEIASVSFSRDRRQAKVSLVLRVIDPRSGFLLNGALAEGLSNPRPIPVNDEEQLVNEAFGNAAFNAVKQISKFNLPVATVLLSGDSGLNGGSTSVEVNKGSRDGMYPNLEMLVTRNGVVTGRIRINEVTNNDSNATVTDLGIGIKPEDRATAIYHLPDYTIDKHVGSFQTASSADVAVDTPSSGTKRNAFNGVGGILVALLAGFLLYSAVRTGHKDRSLGGAAVQAASAVAGRASDLGGSLTSVPVGITIPPTQYIPVAVRITSDTGNINYNNFLEYHVYRSDFPLALSNVNALPGAITVTIQQGSQGNNNNGGGGGTTQINDAQARSGFGQVPLLVQGGHSQLTIFDDPNDKTGIAASKPAPSDSSTLVTISDIPTAVTAGGVTSFGTIPGTGLQFGQRVSYSVEGLYVQPSTFINSGGINPGTSGTAGSTNTNNNNNGGQNNNNGGQNNNTGTTTGTSGHGITYQLTGQRTTNPVTLIEPVHPLGNSVTGTSLSNVNVTVPSTRGGNDYILQISTDPGFSNVQTYSAAPGAYSASPTNPTNQGVTLSTATGSAVVFNNINLTTAFPNGTVFFYRVGARDSANGTDNNPYIFSDPLALILNGNAGVSGLVRALRSGAAARHRSRF